MQIHAAPVVMGTNRIGHIPPLDGLRGLAVIAVMLFHGAVSWSQGGFLGVDLFFVVSGYLITALLLERVELDESVDLAAFYGRRVRRLFPAMLVVVAAVAVFGVAFSSADQAAGIRRDAIGALLYVHNWVQIDADASYFAEFGAPSPLQHLWSLAIEEQWYLVWPAVVLLAARLCRNPRIVLLWISAGLAVASVAVLVVLERRGATIDRLYYGTDTRLHTLAVGSFAATVPRVRIHQIVRTAVVVPTGSALTLMIVMVSGEDRWLYQSGLPVFAALAAALTWAVATPDAKSSLLSWKPLVAIGRISYSLYLWHWPIFIGINPSNTGLDGLGLLVVRLGTTWIASVVTYRLVESLVRRRRVSIRLVATLLGASVAVGALCWFGLDESSDDLAVRTAQVDVSTTTTEQPSAGVPPPTTLQPDSAEPVVLVIGDSIAQTFALFVQPRRVGAEFDTAGGAILGCGLVSPTDGKENPQDPEDRCSHRFEIWRSMMQQHLPAAVVVMTGGWEVFDLDVGGVIVQPGSLPWQTVVRAGLDQIASGADGVGAKVLLATVPCFDAVDLGLADDTASIRNDSSRIDAVNSFYRDLAAESDIVSLLDVAAIVCPDGRPIDEINGIELRYDGVHYTAEGATEVWRALIDEINTAVASAS